MSVTSWAVGPGGDLPSVSEQGKGSQQPPEGESRSRCRRWLDAGMKAYAEISDRLAIAQVDFAIYLAKKDMELQMKMAERLPPRVVEGINATINAYGNWLKESYTAPDLISISASGLVRLTEETSNHLSWLLENRAAFFNDIEAKRYFNILSLHDRTKFDLDLDIIRGIKGQQYRVNTAYWKEVKEMVEKIYPDFDQNLNFWVVELPETTMLFSPESRMPKLYKKGTIIVLDNLIPVKVLPMLEASVFSSATDRD